MKLPLVDSNISGYIRLHSRFDTVDTTSSNLLSQVIVLLLPLLVNTVTTTSACYSYTTQNPQIPSRNTDSTTNPLNSTPEVQKR